MKRIPHKLIPRKIPLSNTVLIVLALDYWSAPTWLNASIITLWAMYFIVITFVVFDQQFMDEEDLSSKRMSGFEKRLKDALKHQKTTNE